MKILFDENTPRPLRRFLSGHSVTTVQEMGWAGVKNGELLTLAAAQGFETLLTFDQNLPHQQNLTGRSIAILVVAVSNKRMETILPLVPSILAILPTMQPGQIYMVTASDASSSVP